uniref:MFS transporter n=1 Tax=Nocardiopsis salina TaxID=245836 RepID=UPI00036C3046
MSAPNAPGPDAPPGPAYVVLLASSALGTLTSTIISAPINVIADAIDAGPSGIVFAVSAFTLAMVLFSPVAGWACERLGPHRVLVTSLGLMVLAQLGAACSQQLWFLVAMRALQGIACSATPPAVQQSLAHFWPRHRARMMAAWASAIGVGQALGLPLGGLVADLLGWRAVFGTHALLSFVLMVLIARIVPAAPSGRPPLHISGMLTLVIGIGSLVGAFTWAGQQGNPGVGIALVVAGVVGLAAHAVIAHHNPAALVDPRLLVERRYLRSTAAAGTVMACLGVVVVATPLHLGREHGMGPETIAAVTVALAVSMTLFAPVSSWIGARLTPRAVLQGGLAALGLGLLTLGWVGTAGQATAVAVTVVVLVVVGSAIGAVQANAALGVMRSAAASHGAALGLHNMLRFSGLACGYAWVAISFPWGSVFVVYAGPVALVLLSFVLLLGPPAAPVGERAGTGG